MSDQSNSPHLEGDDLKRAQRQETFTLNEAALYWAGYLVIVKRDATAQARIRKCYSMLEVAAKSGKLGKVVPGTTTRKVGGSSFTTRWSDEDPPHQFAVPVWNTAKASRADLVSFAKSIKEQPAFLFPRSGAQEAKGPALSESALGEDAGRGEIQGQIIMAVIAALDYKPLKIPTGGKAAIKKACLAAKKFFTDASFDHRWKLLRSKNEVCMAEKEKFKSTK